MIDLAEDVDDFEDASIRDVTSRLEGTQYWLAIIAVTLLLILWRVW